MITENLERIIRDMLGTNVSENQCQMIFEGWDKYFRAMKIPALREETEFRSIIRARILMGSISLVAPELPKGE